MVYFVYSCIGMGCTFSWRLMDGALQGTYNFTINFSLIVI